MLELLSKNAESSSMKGLICSPPVSRLLVPGRRAFDYFIDESEPLVIWLGVAALVAPEMIDAGSEEKPNLLLPVRNTLCRE